MARPPAARLPQSEESVGTLSNSRRWAGWVVALALAMSVVVARAEVVTEVVIDNAGPGPVEEAAVRAFISLKPGVEFDALTVAADVKALEKSGRFSYVEAAYESTPQGVRVSYHVKPKARINVLRISGADYMGNLKIRKWMEIGNGDLVDDTVLAVKSQKVLDEYHKDLFPYTKLTWVITEEKDTGLADVDIKVIEGRRASVRDITFSGDCAAVKPSDIRTAMKQKRRNWISWITGAGTYKPEDLADDLGTIRDLYLNLGYLDTQVGTPRITPLEQAKRILIDIPIQQGKPYTVQSLTFTGVTLFAVGDILPFLKIHDGQPAAMDKIRKSAEAVQDFYQERGYVDSLAIEDIDADPLTCKATVSFEVREGKLGYIRDVLIRGNTRTKDKVIRRELPVYPGEIVNQKKVRIGEQRLRNLNFFSMVNSMHESTLDPRYYDITYDVEEQRTGQFMIGAGFSSIDALLGFIEVGQGNFCLADWPHLTGCGQKIRARATFGTKRTDYEISFVEPWFLNRKLALGVDLFRNDWRFYSDEYNQKNLGGSVSLSKPLTSFDRITLKYALQEITVYDVADDASELIKREEGSALQSSMTLSLLHDTRDSVFIPTRGNRTEYAATLSGGPFGADVDMYRLDVQSSQFIPLWFDHVFILRGWTSVVDHYGKSEWVRIFDRLFLGGPRSLRGFKYRQVGPKDDTGEPLGGNTSAFGSGEYEIPIWKYLRIGAYYDLGMAWTDAFFYNTDYNSDVGLGLRIDIPGFPLRLDYAWPLKADEWNDRSSGLFSFMIGYMY